MCTKKCTIIGVVMVLLAGVSLADDPEATFSLGGNNGVNVAYVKPLDFQGVRQIGIGWEYGSGHWWFVTISDRHPYVAEVWVDGTEVTNGAYASLPDPYNTYFLLGVKAYFEDVDPAFELRLYWDEDEDGVKDPLDTLQDTAIMYLF